MLRARISLLGLRLQLPLVPPEPCSAQGGPGTRMFDRLQCSESVWSPIRRRKRAAPPSDADSPRSRPPLARQVEGSERGFGSTRTKAVVPHLKLAPESTCPRLGSSPPPLCAER